MGYNIHWPLNFSSARYCFWQSWNCHWQIWKTNCVWCTTLEVGVEIRNILKFSMVGMLVPLKRGRWHSPSPNWQEKYHLYTTYILPSGGFYNPYHLLGEQETTLEIQDLLISKETMIQSYNTGIHYVISPIPSGIQNSKAVSVWYAQRI